MAHLLPTVRCIIITVRSKYMRKIIASLLMLAVSAPIFSQLDAKSKEILSAAANKTKSYTSMKATFTITMQNTQDNTSESHEGSIAVSGEKYHLVLLNNESFFDGKTVSTYMKDANEVNISEPDPSDENVLNPAKIFDIYDKGFKAQFVGEKKEGNKTISEIHLFPQSLNKPYSRIKLFIESESYRISQIEQIGKDGNNVQIKIKTFTTNQPIADTEFIFDTKKHPSVDVIDLR